MLKIDKKQIAEAYDLLRDAELMKIDLLVTPAEDAEELVMDIRGKYGKSANLFVFFIRSNGWDLQFGLGKNYAIAIKDNVRIAKKSPKKVWEAILKRELKFSEENES